MSLPFVALRHFDQGDLCELASMPSEMHNFIQAINWLFVGDANSAGCVTTGYTSYMICTLQRPRTIYIRGRPKTLGGPRSITRALLGSCLSRMASWVRLSIACINYEYPSWHLLLSFCIFDLTATGSRRVEHGLGEGFMDECFQRLAKAFKGCPKELQSQFGEYCHAAQNLYTKSESKGCVAAWVSALKRPDGGVRLPTGAILRRCLHALQAWNGFTSSEVKRGLAAIRRVITKHRENLPDTSQSMLAKLNLDVSPAEADEIVHAARKFWLEYWSRDRESGGSRCNFSQKRKKPEDIVGDEDGPLSGTEELTDPLLL